ncbi:MAG: 16S rRNA (cytosine(1402)-N(4))-methyltransferase RsmH [Oscillospiraceae bacterium]|nr:16S rRNA (cytosine(1402)-N(4))-methyltransferase RsmH [Oscillospiraceae bacterium]
MLFHHIPVLPDEVIAALDIQPGGIYLDGTAGGGGHSLLIAGRLTTGRLIAIDKDPAAVAAARQRLKEIPQAQVVEGDFADLADILDALGMDKVDGILLDLGISSHQVDTAERGFSYHLDAPLDMRMSGQGRTAAELIARASAQEMTDIFRRYGEEKFASRIAKNIELRRAAEPILTTAQLTEIIRQSIPAAARREGGHPAKRVFQALRIAVNSELDRLETALDKAFERLNIGGRLAIITFHSLEDRMVKRAFAEYAKGCRCPADFPVCVCGQTPRGALIGRKPQTASQAELAANPRSKSAKLRTIQKLR